MTRLPREVGHSLKWCRAHPTKAQKSLIAQVYGATQSAGLKEVKLNLEDTGLVLFKYHQDNCKQYAPRVSIISSNPPTLLV